MRRFIIPFVLLLAALSSCKVREQARDLPRVTYTATQEYATDSKTSLSGNHILWSSGDAISIFSSSCPGGELFGISDEDAGKSNASFTGISVGESPFYALYPADAGASVDGSVLSLSLPATQPFIDSGFASGFNPMVATSSDMSLHFKNLCALLMIRITGSGTVTSISITSHKAEALWGTATVDMDYTEAPSLVVTAPADDAHRTLTLDCGAGVELGPDPVGFCFVVPAGSLSEGFSFTAVDAQQGSMTRNTTSSLSIRRSVCSSMSVLPYIQTDSPFLSQTVYGVYSIEDGTPSPVKTYEKGTDQLALRSNLDSRIFRIQSLITKSALMVGYQTGIEVGKTCQLTLQSVGDTGVADATVTATLLKSEGGKMWLQETSGNRGFIIAGSL